MGHAAYQRGSSAIRREIAERNPPRDPVIERLEASRDIAHHERDAALKMVADLTAELRRARRCLASARLSHEIQAQQWQAEKEALLYRLKFAANHIRKLKPQLE